MGNRIILVSCIILSIYFVSAVVGIQTIDAEHWCRKTPHTGPCQSLVAREPIRTTAQFVELSVKQTIEGAMQAKNRTYLSLGSELRNPREKAALEDCLELHDMTIRRLNQIMLCPTSHCSPSDVQMWLSSALTSLDTCLVGLSEHNVSDHLLPSMLHDITYLLSNALSLNKRGKHVGHPSEDQKIDAVVAKDGTGNYRTVKEAVDAASRSKGSSRFVIYVKEGIYEEYLYIHKHNLTIVGDGIGKTVFTGSKSYGSGYSTFKSATFVVEAEDFLAKGITFRNTAGAKNAQAVAARLDGERGVFYKCSFEGYQDTLYVHSAQQFFRECDIYGTVDFIFGNAAAYFQNCRIFARKPLNGMNAITAHARVSPDEPTGIVIHNSVISAAPDLLKSPRGSVTTYLGRPWRPYSRTVILNSYLDSLIDPKGWLPWDSNHTVLTTLYYAEYNNTGPASGTSKRVTWPGFHAITDYAEARRFSLSKFFRGVSWLPATNVPFDDN
ncbi:PREDICTED: putative pectinesterase/pectinesterase inhibitor 38 [Tarenaya hassleriana]|uniref:putative pectinesterase/pectinesterase inhibitor 38 n=1 Tax=Tarenaya hassleriana TaxID=28532 RepID=UPI00053C0C14|nr:PREDICTED: putative pectinesterase/pectinesterase inhibitor 38 [Tarenaya hassleriana]